jgi:hypothetical protein
MDLHTVADIKLATRAFNQGWEVSEEIRQQVVVRAYDRATCGDPDIEDKAGKLLLAIDKFNHDVLEAERKKLDAEHARKLQLIETAVKLGLVSNVGGGAGAILGQSSSSVGK